MFWVNFRRLPYSRTISQEKYENAYVSIYFIFFNKKAGIKYNYITTKMQQNFKKEKGAIFFRGDSWSNIYNFLNHAVYYLLQFQTKLIIMGMGVRERPPQAWYPALSHSAYVQSAYKWCLHSIGKLKPYSREGEVSQ